MKNHKILYEDKTFSVVERDGMTGIVPADLSVVILPFERNQKGLMKSIGVLKEFNPFRRGGNSMTLVTGRTEDEDPHILDTAKRELKEEAGFDVSDSERWFFLGNLTTSKLVDMEHPCFAVDVTGLERNIPEGDGSEQENKSEFMMVSVSQALGSTDALIPALFIKVFKFIYGFDIGEQTSEEKANAARKKLDIIALNLDGVNGSLVRHNETGDPYIEYTVKEMTEYIKGSIPDKYQGFDVIIKIAGQ